MGASLQGGSRRGRGRRGGGSEFRQMSEINVTPMVDVMLVLLIIFMVAAPLLTSGVPVDLPKSDAKALSEEENKPIEITVKNDKAFVGDTEVEMAKLVPLLESLTEGQSDRRIYIRADQGLAYGRVMEIIGAVNGAGFTKVALISEKTSGK